MQRVATCLAAALVTLAPAVAFPCGGFFCSGGPGNPPPVVQTGERIFFGYENGETTAIVQILYQGDPLEFAWVVPVPAVPTISVGSDTLFTLLDQATNPTFNVTWKNSCRSSLTLGCGASAALSGVDRTADGGSGVTVVSQGPVGPFETRVLAATDPQALRNYLVANGFDFSQEAADIAATYVAKGDYFVALKLLSDRTVGDLQPIVLKFREATGPCVPIRLTAVAAQPDLGIAVFLAGEGRAVSTNYLNLVVNDAAIDWFQRGANYAQVVTAAANEAGGQGFVTDFAGPSTTTAQSVRQAAFTVAGGDYTSTDPVSFVRAVVASVGLGSQNTLGILKRCVPMPNSLKLQGLAESDFYQSINTWGSELAGTTVAQPQCNDEVQTLVVKPLDDAATLLERLPTLTRLYTTLSPDEMTVDPLFAFNKDLPAVSNVHTVSGEMLCDGSRPVGADLTGSDGRLFSVAWGGMVPNAPALLRAERLAATGQPIVEIDNSAAVDLANRRTLGCGCAVAGGGTTVLFGLLLLLWLANRRSPVVARR